MSQKKGLLLLLLTFALVPLSQVSAERMMATTSTSSRQDMRERMQERKDEMKDRLSQMIHDRVKMFLDRTLARFNAAVARLENIAGRIDTRIGKIQVEGGTTTAATADLAQARTHIKEAKDTLAKIPAAIDGTLSASSSASTTRMKIKDTLRPLFEEAKTHIKEAHDALAAAVSAIKQGRSGAVMHATTTGLEN